MLTKTEEELSHKHAFYRIVVGDEPAAVLVGVEGLKENRGGILVEDVVDDDVVGCVAPAVEGAVMVCDGRILASLLHDLLQRLEDFTLNVGIEIACQEDRGFFVGRDLFDAGSDELDGLAACDLSHMRTELDTTEVT